MKRTLLFIAVAMAPLMLAHARADRFEHGRPVAGGVFTMDNAAEGNNVWAFARGRNGSLIDPMVVSTGGFGSGDGLGNQGGILLSRDAEWLFVCNAGSDEISVFQRTQDGLVLSDRVSSEGHRPVSLTLHRNLLYVLNAGGAVSDGEDSVTAFVFYCGRLLHLPDSTHPLSAVNTGPAQVSFTRSGDHLVVTEKATAIIDVFSLASCGVIAGQQQFISPAPPPFGFAAGRQDRIFITEANGGGANPGGGSVSSYQVTEGGGLETISGSVPTHQTAACWLVLTDNERFAYSANTPNDSISSFVVGYDGRLRLLRAQAATLTAGSNPVDMALSRDDRFLYTLNSGNGTIGVYARHPRSGALRSLRNDAAVPLTANGLAAW